MRVPFKPQSYDSIKIVKRESKKGQKQSQLPTLFVELNKLLIYSFSGTGDWD